MKVDIIYRVIEMKKFTFKGVLDGFRHGSQPQTSRQELDFPEYLKPEHLTLKRTFRHGFPYNPTSLAYDPVQKLIAIGDKSGSIRILGRPGVDIYAKHDEGIDCAVLLMHFLVNDGSLVTVTADDTMHLWNFRQKSPQIVQSLKFQRERITTMHTPVGSKWMYVGTEKGNVHVVNTDTFALSGYTVNWNKAIELVRTSHPGAVMAICDNPVDAYKLLIAFECGLLVLWDLRGKTADVRWQASETITSLAWHYEGKVFVTSHVDGSICCWSAKPSLKPQSTFYPHGRTTNEGCIEKFEAIHKVDLKGAESGDTFTIFCGGVASEKAQKSKCVTIMRGKTIAVLEMEYRVVDFLTLCESPWPCEMQEPYAIAVLLENDFVVIDLLSPGFPCFESPYPMDIHESPVTSCTYLTDCPSDLVPALYSVGRNVAKKNNSSEKDWPLSGGQWSPVSCSYSEIIITGHEDGSMKFWDSGAGTLQVLYKLKTSKVFEKTKNLSQSITFENPVAVHLIYLCSQSRRLCVAGASGYVLMFKFRKSEANSDTMVLEIPILYEYFDDLYGAGTENDLKAQQAVKSEGIEHEKAELPLRVKSGLQRKLPGFQCQLVCFATCAKRKIFRVTALCINSYYGLMAYGTENGIVVLDIVQKVCLLSVASPDLYGGYDPFSRTPKSSKKIESKDEKCYSPSCEKICGESGSTTGQTSNREPIVDMSDFSVPNEANDSASSDGESSKNSFSGKSGAKILPASEKGSSPTNTVAQLNSANATFSIANQQLQSVQQPADLTDPIKKSKSQDKIDGSLSKSRSSSLSSLDMSCNESITCLAFNESPTKRNGLVTITPTLWIGTSFGSILSLPITLPEKEVRRTHPVLITVNGGLIVSAKGSIASLCFLDGLGLIIPSTFEPWRDKRDIKKEKNSGNENKSRKTLPACSPTIVTNSLDASGIIAPNSFTSASSVATSGSMTSLDFLIDKQYIVIASEKQIKIFDVLNQICCNSIMFSKMDYVVKAEAVEVKGGACIAIYLSNGHVMVNSLPSLKTLLDSELVRLIELSFLTKCSQGMVDPMLSIWGQQIILHEDITQISKVFCFSRKGHGFYLASPSEIQKFTMSSEYCQFLMEMECELYTTQTMPEKPKESFFRGLFSGGARAPDKEELFGEQSGKANRSVAKYLPGSSVDQLGHRASTAASEISKAHQMVIERGEKLTQLEEKAEKMASQAQDFNKTSHQLMLKYKDKKWYQL